MRYTIREFESEGKFSQALKLEAFTSVLPESLIRAVLAETGRHTQRERKLNLVITVWVVIGLYLFARCSVKRVLLKLSQGTRLLWGDGEYRLAGDGAVSYRRDQVGVRPLAQLCQQVCQPLASRQTLGAFYAGLRLVGLDGTVDAVADTPANVLVFGRAKSGHGVSAYPQLRGVHLVECGTHALIGSTFWPYAVGERRGAFRLLPRIQSDWLVMWDAGFHDFDLWRAVSGRGAQILAPVPSYLKPEWVQALPDGSAWAYIRPSEPARRKAGERLLVRVINYTLTDPALPGCGKVRRLLTTLLEPERYPLLELVELYHTRWEFELTVDEIETHQRLTDAPLRGLHPKRVLQEAYGLVVAHYLIRQHMHAAAVASGLAPTQLSFVQAIEIIRQAIPEFQLVVPTQHAALRERLWRDLAQARLQPRRLRTAPRVIKRRLSKFFRKHPAQLHVPQPTTTFRDAVAVLPTGAPPHPSHFWSLADIQQLARVPI
jgi:hypothetical protein